MTSNATSMLASIRHLIRFIFYPPIMFPSSHYKNIVTFDAYITIIVFMDNKYTSSKKIRFRKAVLTAVLILLALSALTVLCVIFYHITDSKFDSSVKKDSQSYKYHYAFIGSGSSIDDDIYEAAYKEGLSHDAYVRMDSIFDKRQIFCPIPLLYCCSYISHLF